MPKLGDMTIRFGEVRYRKEVEPIPATSETKGNVTINNQGQPGVPEHFEVSFMLNCPFEDAPVDYSNVFHWTVIVLGHGKDTPYSKIEAEAARQIVPMLRDVAQRLEDSADDC